MLNYLWSFMILTGIVYAAFTGRMPDITNAALDSSKEAISLCITMIGVMSFWVGLMEIASKAGIIPAASRKIRPVIRFLFPNLPAGHRGADKKDEAGDPAFISGYAGGPSGGGPYLHQYDRQYLRSWLGRHSCRIKSNGRIIEIRRTAPQTSGSRYLPPCRNSK